MRSLSTERQTLLAAYGKYSKSVAYYQQTALPLAREQRRTATLSYREGSIGYLDLIQALTDAMNTEQSYIDAFAKLLDTKYKLLYY
jgi:cobalt-zinc-cadmium resistance protein CzcA